MARLTCDRLAVMFQGTIVESGPTEDVLASPRHPYPLALRQAVQDLAPPPPVHRSTGEQGECVYRDRCPGAQDACAQGPPLAELEPGHAVACHFPVPPPRPRSTTTTTTERTAAP